MLDIINQMLENAYIAPNFTTIWDLWLGIYNTITYMITFAYIPLDALTEEIVYKLFDITIDIQFSLTLMDIITSPIMIVILALGITGTIFRLAKDIVNPFN